MEWQKYGMNLHPPYNANNICTGIPCKSFMHFLLTVQIVCGRMLGQQLSGEGMHNEDTEPRLQKTLIHGNDGGTCTLWVASVPHHADIEGQLPVNCTEEVPIDSKISESDRP